MLTLRYVHVPPLVYRSSSWMLPKMKCNIKHISRTQQLTFSLDEHTSLCYQHCVINRAHIQTIGIVWFCCVYCHHISSLCHCLSILYPPGGNKWWIASLRGTCQNCVACDTDGHLCTWYTDVIVCYQHLRLS